MKKGLWLIAFLIFSFLSVGGNAQPAQAAETEKVDFILHKIVFPEGQMPAAIQNNGSASGELADLLKEYRGLNDVTFETYDVSQEFYQLIDSGLSATTAQKQLAQKNDFSAAQLVASKTTMTIAGQAGTAEYLLPAKDSQGRDAVYLFHESNAPDVVSTKAGNLVVVLPVYGGSGQALTTVHLYPKNESRHLEPTFEKTIKDQKDSYQYGDVVNFQVKTKIPSDLVDYQFYKIQDSASPGLFLQQNSIKISLAGEDVSKYFTLTQQDHGFLLTAKDINSLAEYYGKNLVIDYAMTVTNQAVADSAVENQASLTSNFDRLTHKVVLYVGGKHFIKVDAMKESQKLKNAVFLIENTHKQFLIRTETGYSWSNDSADKQRVTLVSDESGNFEIQGLAYGKYQLKEIQAPTGYVLASKNISFTVAKNSYSNSAALKIVNLAEATTNQKITVPPATRKNSLKGKIGEVAQALQKKFPQTDDESNIWFMVVGVLLLSNVAYLGYRGKKAKNEKGE